MKQISGFSKLDKDLKIDYIVNNFLSGDENSKDIFKTFWHENQDFQKVFDEFSENTLSNFFLPFGVVPNVVINDKNYCVPMVIEESSVVAAASKAAKYWHKRGGFKSKVLSTQKIGQVHFYWHGDENKLKKFFDSKKVLLLTSIAKLEASMKKRGGGVEDLVLIDKTADEKGYHQLKVSFETCDAMGANFINTVLESIAQSFKEMALEYNEFSQDEKNIEIVMSILSNFTPECIVETYVECPVEDLVTKDSKLSGAEFARKFERAIRITKMDTYRATTHNKGIMNGIDAVVLATGNDFRAIEACAHAYAVKDGSYKGLSDCEVKDGNFRFSLKIPLALGTVGGLTSLHPLSKLSLQMLGNPNAKELMQVVSTLGLAQNFAAIRSLITTGIQKGHMKMHLMNILNHLQATQIEQDLVKKEFANKAIAFNDVKEFIYTIRKIH